MVEDGNNIAPFTAAQNGTMQRLAICLCASSMIFCLNSFTAEAQAPPTNSVTLNWTNPTAYTNGQPLTIGVVSIFEDGHQVQQSSVINTFTSDVLPPGEHSFTVEVCDNLMPQNCSPLSQAAMVSIPSSVVLVVPPITNLTGRVNP